jgi:glycosyltransferase involved in cell wall biosynthesis
MKHYIFYISNFKGGGAESVFIRVANSLVHKAKRVTFIVNKLQGELLKTIDPRINIITLNSKSIFLDILFIGSFLKKNRFERFYTTLNRPNLVGFMASLLAGTKNKHFARVAAVHSETLLQSKASKRKLLLYVLGFLYPKFGNLVSISEAVKLDLINKYQVPEKRILKIYNPKKPMDFSEPLPLLKDNNAPFRILVVGRLVEQKNVDKIIKVFVRFLEFETNSEILILGDGEKLPYLKQLVFNLKVEDKVRFMGFVENPSYYYQQSDVFILFSSWEGLPNVVLDALVHNLQIIVSDAPGGSCELIDNGKYGRIVANKDENALLQAVIDARSKPMQVDNIAKQEFLCQFDLEHITNLYEGVMSDT